MNKKNIVITGSAGFIGFHLSLKLLKKGHQVIGIDNLNDYYDVRLKKDRNKILQKYKNYLFKKIDIKNLKELDNIFKKRKIYCVIHLAAQAGVRYSLINPKSYIENNILGFFNVLDTIKKNKVKKFVYASTSSIYGLQKKFPLKEKFNTDNPIQLYAATKKSNEVMAASYSYLYKIDTIGLRFFTVYGPWGRPDMALFKFTKNILKGKPIDIFNKGRHIRDFTYVEDIVNGILKIIISKKINLGPKIYNIGNGKKISLMKYIELIEKNLMKKSKKRLLSLQKGDVIKTHSDTSSLKKDYNYYPNTSVEKGVKKFIEWYISYFKQNKKKLKKSI
jgi:UDP-glucuronate 4-epimerase